MQAGARTASEGGRQAFCGRSVVALTLLAAALFNAAHLAQGRFGAAAGVVALAAAAAVMVAVAGRSTIRGVVLLGAAGYAFLLAGNQVAVMPFMGWIDIGPVNLQPSEIMKVTLILYGAHLIAERPKLTTDLRTMAPYLAVCGAAFGRGHPGAGAVIQRAPTPAP